MLKKIHFGVSFVVAMGLLACEDVIDFQTQGSGNAQLVIDAWITDVPGQTQTVKLSLTQPYFDSTKPTAALGAEVFVANEDSVIYRFSDIKQNGVYTWTPTNAQDKILTIGTKYLLYVQYQGEEYISTSETKRVPKIDSIIYTEEELPFSPGDTLPKKGFVAEFYGTDFTGPGDTYWIRSYRNDTLRNKPSEISLAWDAAFSSGTNRDASTFILPVRQSITIFPYLFQDKDKIKVELFSIPNEAFYFLNLVRTFSTNAGLFSVPQSNLPSNIVNRKKDGKTPLGFFCTSAVSSLEVVLDKTKAKKKP